MSWDNFNKRGECGCVLCGRPLKAKEVRRYIHIGEGGGSILRADLITVPGKEYVLEGKTYTTGEMYVVNGVPDTGDLGWFAVGSTCAKKLGPEFSKELAPLGCEV